MPGTRVSTARASSGSESSLWTIWLRAASGSRENLLVDQKLGALPKEAIDLWLERYV